ncbi:MAG: gephyrin-like molybdotransferase Glp [Desulfatiglans sp.]|jgi:molybdopterin molybdotransferase|nr:molybdopterin molybdotransferase MoeA [Thermodesulfobacteriota bacterium]MEE4352739.1 gephyrin-like molybdotransferase Glp [Desulfatiglans sp.]
MESFFKVKTPKEVLGIMDGFGPLGEEEISLGDSLGRILSKDVLSPEDLPGFARSSMDGYAVKAEDTFGATESLPALLAVSGEVLMGERPRINVGQGQAVRISTGGMLPKGADGVVMVEYCHLIDEDTLEVNRAISPLENVIQPGDDVQKGDRVLKQGHQMRPQDVGVMAGLGKTKAFFYRKPRVAIISTGDEIVGVDKQPLPGQVRDMNRYTLSSFCLQEGAEPIYVGLCPDDFEPMKAMVERALEKADSVWISGGSSVGTRDLTLQVLETLPQFELLVHGISISPGKPTIIGQSGLRSVIGLPGHVGSALVVAKVFLSRLIHRLSGCSEVSERFPDPEARLSRNVESASGREDYVRVRVVEDRGRLVAEPIFGKSGLISTLVEADAFIRIDRNAEGLYQGETVKLIFF